MNSYALKWQNWSIARLVSFAQNFMPQAEAEFLAMTYFKVKRSEIYLSRLPIEPMTALRFYRLVQKAGAGVPIQYLVNSTQFLEFEIFVDQRVFIPRPETEELILRVQTRIKNPKIIVDYGTGSGCIAIALARIFPTAKIFAVDISNPALDVARINIQRYQLDKQISSILADSLDSPKFKFLKNKVDLLISNPPYIPSERLNYIDKRVRNYEPLIALNGGPEGTSIISMLITHGPELIKLGGMLALEIDETHDKFIKNRLPDAWIEHDIYGKIRYAYWQKGNYENWLGHQLE
jgi:release factor glutamine methyltransferase|uniref:peptide chain release factor N(5)-glutamine methyltransferase n=1 Tax=candidate division WOR-3 bacterium TaxID=2052148 RepID=A0A7V3PUS3_UNCW3